MKRIFVTLLAGSSALLSLSSFSSWAAASSSDAVAAGTQEPPLCTEKDALRSIRKGYEFIDSQAGNVKIKDIIDIKQVKVGAPPPSVNQYATKTSYGVSSRWCEATLLLSDGKRDSMYWRMDYLVEGKGHSINYDTCALRHDLVDTKCQRHRAGS